MERAEKKSNQIRWLVAISEEFIGIKNQSTENVNRIMMILTEKKCPVIFFTVRILWKFSERQIFQRIRTAYQQTGILGNQPWSFIYLSFVVFRRDCNHNLIPLKMNRTQHYIVARWKRNSFQITCQTRWNEFLSEIIQNHNSRWHCASLVWCTLSLWCVHLHEILKNLFSKYGRIIISNIDQNTRVMMMRLDLTKTVHNWTVQRIKTTV